jgi:pantothenate kinase
MISKLYLERVHGLLASGKRQLLGIVGPPGAGKSTLAQELAQALGDQAVVVPMDGYHLANAELARLQRAGRKGAQDTFDCLGYLSLLRRLKANLPGETVYAPAFDRVLEEPMRPGTWRSSGSCAKPGCWSGICSLADQCKRPRTGWPVPTPRMRA